MEKKDPYVRKTIWIYKSQDKALKKMRKIRSASEIVREALEKVL